MPQPASESPQSKVKESKVNNSKIYRSFAHLSITLDENQKLLDEGRTQKILDYIYDAIENYKKNTSYKSLYLTARKRLEKEKKPNKVVKQEPSEEEAALVAKYTTNATTGPTQ